MSEAWEATPGALVVYKGRPARLEKIGPRWEVLTADGQRVRVRPKDVILLHPGPAPSPPRWPHPSDTAPLHEAWEVLQGEPPFSLADLALLAYGEFTPASAWAVWTVLQEDLLFEGTPQALRARPAAEVAARRQQRAARAAQRRAWAEFIQRARQGRIDPQVDAPFLAEVEALALGERHSSRVLEALGLKQTSIEAHRLLLQWQVWTPRRNPYPTRYGLPQTAPDLPLPALPQEDRLDLTHLRAWAIDDEGSQDPDDALSWDGERIWVHVADVAALVPPESAADREARQRGSSVYLPEGVIPMLPDAARQRLGLGLQPVSPALSFGLRLHEGELQDVVVRLTWVRVTRLSYAQAESLLDQESDLRALWEQARRYLQQRNRRGALTVQMPEVKVRVTLPDGPVSIQPLPPLRSRDLVREAMLMAGEAAARYAQAHNLPVPYTTQPPPRDLDEVPPGLAGMYALRRTFHRSEYKSTPDRHSGLGLDAYVQVTSPLRRYLDLVAHQQIRAHLSGQLPLDEAAILERVGMVEAGRDQVRLAERRSRRHWTLVYLLERPSWEGEGIVVDQTPPWVTVVLPALGLEERLHARGEVPLNSTVQVRLRQVSLPDLKVHLQFLGVLD